MQLGVSLILYQYMRLDYSQKIQEEVFLCTLLSILDCINVHHYMCICTCTGV